MNIKTLPIIMSFIFGYISYNFLQHFMLIGQKGLFYYAEAHLSFWNCLVHTIFMPVSMTGLLLLIPTIFRLKPEKANILMHSLLSFYIGHYIHLNIAVVFIFLCKYLLIIDNAKKMYREYYRKYNLWYIFRKGIIISIIGLGFQELFGHYMFNDIPSRIEGIPNAILYALYFSISHLLE